MLLFDLLDVDAAYRKFFKIIKKAAEKTIPPGHPNNHILCWDAKCKSLNTMFLQSPQGDDLSSVATFTCQTLQETVGLMVQSSLEHVTLSAPRPCLLAA